MRKLLDILLIFVKFCRHIVEFILFISVVIIGNLIPFRASSWLFGMIFANLGIFLPPSHRILNNLRFIYPLMDEIFVRSLTKKIWFNTGRFAGETPHFFFRSWRSLRKYVTLENEDILINYAQKKQSVIIILEHIGNWWFVGKFLSFHGITAYAIYRKPNNPLINLVYKVDNNKKIAKGSLNMKQIITAISAGSPISIFQDHRDGNGIPLPLLDKTAMTSVFFAKLATKYNLPVIGINCLRQPMRETKFTMKFSEIYHPDKDGKTSPEALARIVNDHISRDIQQNKWQWFWLHRRWK